MSAADSRRRNPSESVEERSSQPDTNEQEDRPVRRTAVESGAASTKWKRRLKESGFDDEQAQAVLDVTGAGEDRSEVAKDVAELSQDVTALKLQATATEDRFVSFRDEIVARSEASEERVKGDIATLRGEIATLRGEIATLRGEIENLRTEFHGEIENLRTELRGEIEKLGAVMEARFKLIVWLLGAGLTLYTGTTISLMVFLFRSVAA